MPNKIISIPNFIDIDENVKESDNIANEKSNYVLYCGRLRKEKRVDLLLNIWNRVENSQKNCPWTLLIVGDGPDRDKYVELSSKLGLEHVQWLGYQNNPRQFYMNSKILCVTSEYEGFCLALIEAERDGVVPIVFDSYAAARDIVVDGYNGFLIPPFNIDAFADSLLSLMNDSTKLNQMSKNAIKDVKRFSEDVVMKRWVTLIQSVVCEYGTKI